SLATGLLVVARSMWDAMDHLMDVQFHQSMREDLTVTFMQPVPERAISELAHLPGVFYAEGLRSVPVRIEAGHRFRDGVAMGYPDDVRLRRLVDSNGAVFELPESGVVDRKSVV